MTEQYAEAALAYGVEKIKSMTYDDAVEYRKLLTKLLNVVNQKIIGDVEHK